jgi:hypothetical protein
LPSLKIPINDYATSKNPFVLINSTESNLDSIIKDNLIVNSNLNPQPFVFINNVNNSNGMYGGISFEKWINRNDHSLKLIYNDSALFSMIYLVNTLSNMYSRLDKTPLIQMNITTWPKSTDQSILSFFDSSSFSSLIILGTALILPLVTFATEVVHERELKCRSQLRLNGCTFSNYWITSFFCFLVQYSLLPILLFFFIYAIPQLNIAAFNPSGIIKKILFIIRNKSLFFYQ